jgi:hypothetical protein
VFGACAVFHFSSPAAAQKKSPGLQAVVVSDGAAVYEKPDFDSKVIDFVPFQTPVVISRKSYAGTEGLGLFHKVRVRGKIGYIPDTDIRVGEKEREREKVKEKEKPEPAKVKAAEPKPKSMAFDKDEDDAPGRAPIYLSRYLGAAVSRVKFTEKFSGHKLSDQIVMYGLRMTGPGTLFDGPPLDVNILFSLDEPSYYDIFSSGAHGFMLFGDIMALFPLVNLDNWVVSYGFGLMWNYTRYRVQIQGENTDSLDFRIGLDAGIGLGFRIGKSFVVRADAKYYYEKSQYAGYTLSLQREY